MFWSNICSARSAPRHMHSSTHLLSLTMRSCSVHLDFYDYIDDSVLNIGAILFFGNLRFILKILNIGSYSSYSVPHKASMENRISSGDFSINCFLITAIALCKRVNSKKEWQRTSSTSSAGHDP